MALAFSYGNNSTIVETRQGKVRGYTYNGMSIFKGIPYATAKRFQAPQPVEPWEGVKDATSYGYVCPLLEMEEPKGELFVPHRYWVMDENCQNLNVWTPACDGEKRPVMVWLHGGGYFAGSSIEQVAYEGENMCKYGQVVVVSINHRLNILGYMDVSAFGEEYANSGNAGSDDMVAALQWIHDNIEKFGGDPDNVTLFGQSGGGSKITTLLQTPAADGLFAKGIIMSGIAGMALEDSTGDGEELAIAMMAELGTEDFHDLETIPYARLAEAYLKVKPEFEAKGKYVGGSPHPNAFYKGEPRINGFREETSQIPLLIGTVFGEFSSFGLPLYNKHEMTEEQQEAMICQTIGEEGAKALIPLFREAYPERPIVDLLKLDFIFRLPTQEYIKLRSGLNPSTYSYFFNLDMPVDGECTPWHCADIPYVFHNTDLVPVTQEEGVTEVIESQIFEAVMAFAHTGKPDHDGIPHWPASTPEEENTLMIDKNTRLVINHDQELVPLAAKYVGPVFAKMMEETQVQH